MFNKNKKIIEKIVDIKNYLNSILITTLIIIFPLNQQYHFRPFPSVDGFIIDYLIIKISITEILVIFIFLFNVIDVFKLIKTYLRKPILIILILLLLVSTVRSKYPFLALYENFILIIITSLIFYFYKNLYLIKISWLEKSVKFWLITLSLIGFAQFYYQSSVFNNYPLTGEFPYSDDYYHIKQKTLLFENLIPPYSIFSHSNIFGAYLIFLIFILFSINKNNFLFLIIVFLDLVIIGSVACFLAFLIFLITTKLPQKYLKILLELLLITSISIFFLFCYKYNEFSNDYSIYRRLYMFDLSANYFIDTPVNFLFGSGYYNYFIEVKSDLYLYEVVRFFQPPHYLFIFIIWQYGFIFLGLIIFLLIKNFQKLPSNILRILILITILGSFDHYILSNHQLRILLLLAIPYSLQIKNKV